MKQKILISICCIFILSCNNDREKADVAIEFSTPISDNTVVSFNITSKDSNILEKGTNVSMRQMITKNIKNGEEIVFKDQVFTLNNNIEGALNFYSIEGKLMCNIPTDLSLMSMPPNGLGQTIHRKGEDIELSGTMLMKINSINFVISDIRSR